MKLKEIAKKDSEKVTLYRAFVLKDGDSINLHTDGTYMYFTVEDAIQGLLNHDEDFHKDLWVKFLKDGKIDMVVLVKVEIPLHNQKEIVINQYCEDCYNEESGALNIVLADFKYDIDVDEIDIIDLAYKIDNKTEIKKITHLKYESLNQPKKKKKKD